MNQAYFPPTVSPLLSSLSIHLKKSDLPSPLPKAFTLVEVALALSIIAFAFVTLLGLLQSGMSSFRDSMDRSVSSQIAQEILNEKRKVDFSTLTASTSPSLLSFTEDGEFISTPADSIYTARVSINPSVSVPGPGTGRFINRSLAKVAVEVVRRPGGISSSSDPVWNDPKQARLFTALIPRT